MGARRPRYVNVLERVRAARPDITDPLAAIEQGSMKAVRGVEYTRRWRVGATMRSPILGMKGAEEWLLHARLVEASE
jgi:hypothetical protein